MTALTEMFPSEWVNHELPNDVDDIVGIELPYLDKGFVQLVDYMGDDMATVNGARASFRETADEHSEARNRGLINYLIEHKHTSPIELIQLKFRVRIPLSVRAQHVRHRTQSCNWESHRYQQPTGEFYLPPIERIRSQDKFNKQGSGEPLSEDDARIFINCLRKSCWTSWDDYDEALRGGISRETARDLLHPNFYCTGIFSMNLRNLFHYLKLRNDGHAQPEIRLLANTIEQIVAKAYPITYEAWVEFDKEAVTFSRSEFEIIRGFMADYEASWARWMENEVNDLQEFFGGSKRRVKDFYNKLFQQG